MAKRIYVGNLPYTVDGQQLASLFGEYGEVIEATVITDRDTGQSKGFGFVQMADDNEALNAISQLNGSQLGNRTIRVNEAQPRVERAGGGGGGGRGYGRESRGGRYDNRGSEYRGDRSSGWNDSGYDSGSRWADSNSRQRRERQW